MGSSKEQCRSHSPSADRQTDRQTDRVCLMLSLYWSKPAERKPELTSASHHEEPAAAARDEMYVSFLLDIDFIVYSSVFSHLNFLLQMRDLCKKARIPLSSLSSHKCIWGSSISPIPAAMQSVSCSYKCVSFDPWQSFGRPTREFIGWQSTTLHAKQWSRNQVCGRCKSSLGTCQTQHMPGSCSNSGGGWTYFRRFRSWSGHPSFASCIREQAI